MKNSERQVALDVKKWVESEEKRCDCSGAMYYCGACERQVEQTCGATQEERERGCLCAKAYNRSVRGCKGNGKQVG